MTGVPTQRDWRIQAYELRQGPNAGSGLTQSEPAGAPRCRGQVAVRRRLPRIEAHSGVITATTRTAPRICSTWRIQSTPLVCRTPIHPATALPRMAPRMPQMMVSHHGMSCLPRQKELRQEAEHDTDDDRPDPVHGASVGVPLVRRMRKAAIVVRLVCHAAKPSPFSLRRTGRNV